MLAKLIFYFFSLMTQFNLHPLEELITSNHREAELYSKYKAYYGHAFFICKKRILTEKVSE